MRIEQIQSAHRIARRRTALRDYRLVFFGAAALLTLVALGDRGPLVALLRIMLAGIYILFVPGYCIVAALFPRRDDLDGIERTGLSLGLSLAVIPVLALVLDALPWGIQLWPILLIEYSLIFLSICVAVWRRAGLSADVAHVPPGTIGPKRWWRSLPLVERRVYRLIGAGASIVVLSAAWVFLVPSRDQYMTAFYILGKQGNAEDYIRQGSPEDVFTVTIGIENYEQVAQTYRIEGWVSDLSGSNRRELVVQDGPFSIAQNERLERPVSWKMPRAGMDQNVEFLLFNGEQAEPYRRVRLWINVADGLPLR